MNTRPVVPNPLPYAFPSFKVDTLLNGFTAHTLHRPGSLLASAVLEVPVSVNMDPVGKEGLALLTASLLTEGTRTRSGDDFAIAMDLLGVHFSVGASDTSLYFSVEAPATSLPETLLLVSEAVFSPLLEEDSFTRVQRQIMDSIRAQKSSPAAAAMKEHLKSLWTAASRASLPSSGTEETMANVELQDVRAFARTFSPSGATLVVAGDLSGVNKEALLAPFALLSSGDPTFPVRENTRAMTPRLVYINRADATQSEILMSGHTAGRADVYWAAQQVASYAFGGSITARINALLRETKGFTYGISSYLAPDRGAATFGISGAVEAEHTVESVSDLLTLTKEARDDGFTEEEVHSAAAFLTAVAPLRWEASGSLTVQISALLADGMNENWLNGYLSSLMRTTTASAHIAFKQLSETLSITVVGPQGYADELAALTGLPLTVID